MDKRKETYSNYRWVVEFFIVMGTLGFAALWLAPAPLLPTIMGDLSINMAQAGLIISVLALCVALFSSLGSISVDKVGAKKSFLIALILVGAGGLMVLIANNYPVLILTRLVLGIGYAMILSIPGVLIMTWFPDNEKPYINTINSSLTYVGMTIAFSLTLPIYNAMGSWKAPLAIYGGSVLVVAALWLVIGKDKKVEIVQEVAAEKEEEVIKTEKVESALKLAMKRKEVWLMALALFGGMWEFQFFTTFLPTYYQTYYGLDATTASNITGIITSAGIVGGILCGVAMGMMGVRKIFTWPLHTLLLFGLIGAINFQPGPLLYLSVGLIGFCAAGWTPALMTIPMEFEGMTPRMLGGAFALIFGLGNAAAFISPVFGGWLSEIIGLKQTLFIFAFSQLLAIACTILVPETGPKGKMKKLGLAGE